MIRCARLWSSDFSLKTLLYTGRRINSFRPLILRCISSGGTDSYNTRTSYSATILKAGAGNSSLLQAMFLCRGIWLRLQQTEEGDTAYLVGGYGSTTGDQTINPRFTYDFTLYDVRKRAFKTLFHLKEPARQFCFGNHMVIDAATNSWHALVYPTDRFNAALQLVHRARSPLPAYTPLGDSIPYSYYDIASYADLYYCRTSKKLLAVTIYTANNRSQIKVYTIDFPPGQCNHCVC